jgi:hypothetical protein
MKPVGKFHIAYTDDNRQTVSRLIETYQSIIGKNNVRSEFREPLVNTNKVTHYIRVITLTSRKLGVANAMYLAGSKGIHNDFISSNYQETYRESLPIRYRKKWQSARRAISVVVVGMTNPKKGKH